MIADPRTVRARLRQLVVGAAAACVAAGAIGWTLAAQAADARTYPNRPLRIVVPFAAGSQMASVARLVGGKLAEAIDQPVLIENHPGASGNIGSDVVAKAPPDGYTLLMTGR